MINHRHKCIFVHIPKCGGISMEKLMSQWPDNEPIGGKKNSEFKVNEQHGTLSEQIEFYNINKNMFSFTFIRNPWSRFVSYFFHLKKMEKLPIRESFSEFTMNLLSKNWICEYITPINPPKNFMAPCTTWTSGVDFIGRFENLQEDFNIICKKIGIPKQKLPHINKTKHKHYTEYYDDETREIVAKKYAKDIEYFGYEFGE